MKDLQAWWRGLVARERMMVLAGLVSMAACLYYLLVLEPLDERIERLEKSLRAEADTLQWLESQRPLIAARGGTRAVASNDGRSILAVINDAASTHGVAIGLKRVTPVNERSVTLGFEDVAYAGFMQWLVEMVEQRGATVERIRMERREYPGVVTVEISLLFP
jgi:general secretion pathway protein M